MIGLLVIIGLAWVCARGFDSAKTSIKRHTAARRKAVPDAHQRRAGRQAATGWWLGEALHLFPTTRHGFSAGWENHRDAWNEHRVATAKRQADHAERRLDWQAQIAEHLRRLETAAQKYREGPSMSDQLRSAVQTMRGRLGDHSPPPDPDILPDGKTPGRTPEPDPDWTPPADWAGKPGWTRRPYPYPDEDFLDDPGMDPEWERRLNGKEDDVPAPAPGCKDPTCACHRGSSTAPDGSGNGSQSGGTPVATTSGEPTFHSVNEQCDRAYQEAESVAGPNLEACADLADNLGAVIRDDSDMMGKAAELAAAARAFEAARSRVLDAAQAVKDHNEQHYAAHQDATDSTGVTPEREYTASG
jgi:hypothetical protein